MFLFIDESDDATKKVLGGILLPTSRVSSIEKDFVELRIQNKLFGEVKWTGISNAYSVPYLATLDLFWNNREATYHSISYRQDKNKYKAAYMLIKAVSWKIQNHYGLPACDPLYVLFDNNGSIGTKNYPVIKQYLARDRAFQLSLEFCNHGASHVLGCLQISDVFTGAVASKINATGLGPAKRKILSEIELKNRGQIGIAINRFPRLYEYKMHHFDATRL